MTLAGTTWAGLTQAVERGLRGLTGSAAHGDIIDPYERAPLDREDMTTLFELDQSAPVDQCEALRASERHERDSMSIIRAALYDCD